MAKKVIEEAPIIENINSESLDGIMGDRYAVYAKYVIQDRAIPDVRDGLKPVQRRIIYSMFQTGNTFEKQTRKCAKIVGDVMGRFHPHGDSSIYEALVRLSQTWKMSMPLVTFQGNNGSIDNDPAAAYRYTEAKLNEFSELLIQDIDKNTVDMSLNFDDTEFEPVVLPCRYPNLFVNGSDGIAVAIATSIPPHNLEEMCNAAIYRLENPNWSLDELLEIVKAQDFPTGGIIYNSSGIRDIYETGKGKIEIASKLSINKENKNYNEIIITEIPYGVVKQQLVVSIDKIKKSKEVDGILEVRDLSSGDEIKIVIELKKDIDPEIIVQYLMNKTNLKISYTSNIVAICNKHPETLGLIKYLDYYNDYQKEVIIKRSKFDLEKSKNRHHIIEGLIRSQSIIDEIIKIIKKSEDKADSKRNLMKTYNFSEPQAEAIVTMRLYRLSHTDVSIYIKEKEDLEKTIKELTEIIENPNKLKRLIINDLKNIVKKFGIPRRSVIVDKKEEVSIDKRDLIAKEDVYVVITRDGYIKRSTIRSYSSSNGSLPGVKENDVIVLNTICNTVDSIVCITSKGNYLTIPVHEIFENRYKDEGKHINYLCNLPLNENIIRCFVIKDFTKEAEICTVSSQGNIKKTSLLDINSSLTTKPTGLMKILNSDYLVDACLLNGNSNILTTTKEGYYTYINESNVPISKPKASGVKLFSKLGPSDIPMSCISFSSKERAKLIFLTDKGMIKIVDISSLKLKERYKGKEQVLKSFKNDCHSTIFVGKVPNINEPTKLNCLISDGSLLNLTIDDYHTTSLDKYCKCSIPELPESKSIVAVFNDNAEIVDTKFKVEYSSNVVSPVELNIFGEPQEEQPKDKKIKLVTIDAKEKNSPEEEHEERIEQISIFDDMGD